MNRITAPATYEGADEIARVHVRSWQVAYADILDREFLASLSVEERAMQWRRLFLQTTSQTLLPSQDGCVIGFINFGSCQDEGTSQDQGEIWALYAEPSVWGQGVGRALLEQAVQQSRSRGYGSTSLWVLSQNRRGITFYETFGFRHVQGSEKQFNLGGRQVEEVRFHLRLKV